MKEFEKFTISQAGIIIENNKCLIMEFSENPGRWGLPGGRIDRGEGNCEKAFRRELKEELNITKFKILGMVDFDAWITSSGTPVSSIIRLIDFDTKKIKLSDEHRQSRWAGLNELDNYNFMWPNARRMIKKGFELNDLLKNHR